MLTSPWEAFLILASPEKGKNYISHYHVLHPALLLSPFVLPDLVHLISFSAYSVLSFNNLVSVLAEAFGFSPIVIIYLLFTTY